MHGFGAGLRAVVGVVHSAIVDVVSVLDGEPGVLLDLLVVLSRLHVYYIELGGLLVVHSLLVHGRHAVIAHHSLSVIRQLRSGLLLLIGFLFGLLISLRDVLLAVLLSGRGQGHAITAIGLVVILQRVVSPRGVSGGRVEEGHGVLDVAGEAE